MEKKICHPLSPSRVFPIVSKPSTSVWNGCSAELTADGGVKVDELATSPIVEGVS